MSPHGIHIRDGNIPSQGSAFCGPQRCSIGRGCMEGAPTLLASDRLRTSIIMLLHGHHRRWVASVAQHIKTASTGCAKRYWSRPVPPTHPHGKACSGCAANSSITSATLVHRGAARAAIRRCSGCWRGAGGPAGGEPSWRAVPLSLSGCRTSPGRRQAWRRRLTGL